MARVSRGPPHPVELTLAFSPVLGSIRGFILFLVCNKQLRLRSHRIGIFVVFALRVLHILSFSDGFWGMKFVWVLVRRVWLGESCAKTT